MLRLSHQLHGLDAGGDLELEGIRARGSRDQDDEERQGGGYREAHLCVEKLAATINPDKVVAGGAPYAALRCEFELVRSRPLAPSVLGKNCGLLDELDDTSIQ